MVRVILLDSGIELEVKGGKIVYKKEVADIGDVTAIKTSHTWNFAFEKTPNITNAFKGLGIVGDVSDIPYKKIPCAVLDNGVPIVRNGLLKVKETTDTYKAYVQDGIIEWYSSIKDDKISGILDLSDLDHLNTVSNIIDSFTNNTYRYIIANYNGIPLANVGQVTNLNPLALVPSVNLQYLWDLIFGYYGWTYSGNFDFSDMWMTYPNALYLSDVDNINILTATPQDVTYTIPHGNHTRRLRFDIANMDAGFLSVTPSDQRHTFIFSQAGNYRAKFNVTGFYRLLWPPVPMPFQAEIRINGVPSGVFSLSDEDEEIQFDFIAYLNTVLQIIIIGPSGFAGTFYITGSSLTVETLGVQDVSFSEALIKFKVKDFFKELCTRKALTPFADVEAKNIHFLSLDERLTADYVDVSDKFIKRKSEKYIKKGYNQLNYLRHKYDKSGDDYNDGILRVNNENLPEAKTLYKSPTYAPLEELVTYTTTSGAEYFVNNFKMFEVEVEEDADTGDLIANYKPLKNRFYIMQSETVNQDLYILGTLTQTYPLANINGNTFDDLAEINYANVKKILDNARIHKMDMDFTGWDIANIGMKKIHFIKQEAAFYLINSIKAESGKFAEVEYIKIQAPEELT